MKEEYVKSFYEERTKIIHSTLEDAILSINHPCVYRCWMADGEIKAKALLYIFGVPVCTIKDADKKISLALRNGSVGKGYKDKRYVV